MRIRIRPRVKKRLKMLFYISIITSLTILFLSMIFQDVIFTKEQNKSSWLHRLQSSVHHNLPPTSETYTSAVKDVPEESKAKLNVITHRRLGQVCTAIARGDTDAIENAKYEMASDEYERDEISDGTYMELTENCDLFKQTRGYLEYIVTEEERRFPLAFSILLYKQVEQAERLLRLIYRPHNVYCLNVDADAEATVKEAVRAIAACFDNVFVVTKMVSVVYEGFSFLQSTLNCMQDMVDRGREWKYFMNLPSQQFPLKTNLEIVNLLKLYNGSNDVEGKLLTRNQHYFNYKHKMVYVPRVTKPKIVKMNQKKSAPPFNVTIYKGSTYGTFSRHFVEFALTNKAATRLLDWLRDTMIADELFWSTLSYNSIFGAPGRCKGPFRDSAWKTHMSLFAVWNPNIEACPGKFVRDVCVFGVGGIPSIIQQPHLFVNKLYIDYQPLAYECLEEWYWNKAAYPDTSAFNISYYQELGLPCRN